MKLPKKTFHFLAILAASASLLVLLTLVQNPTRFFPKAATRTQGEQESVTIDFSIGYTLFSVPLRTGLTADDICNKSKAYMILGWDETTQSFLMRGCGTFGTNFNIEPNRGYAVVSHESSSFTFIGKKYPFTYKLAEGFNLIGLPYAEKKSFETASDLCGREITPTMNLTQAIRIRADVVLIPYYCDDPEAGIDFELKKYEAYFIYAENPEKPGKRYGELKLPEL